MQRVRMFEDGIGLETVERGDFTGQRTQRLCLEFILLGNLLQALVAGLDGFFFCAELIEALRLDQHAGIRTGHAGNGHHANDRAGDEDVNIMQGNRNLQKFAFCVPRHQHDVKTFPQLNRPPYKKYCNALCLSGTFLNLWPLCPKSG